MKYLPSNTLAYFHAAPYVRRYDVSAVPVKVFSTATEQYLPQCGQREPYKEALAFYTLNHLAAIVRKSFTPHETLPEWALQVMDAYSLVSALQGERLLHYILLIATREMRHWDKYGKFDAPHWSAIEKAGTKKMVTFIKNLQDGAEDMAAKKYLTKPPNVTIGQYVAALSAGFHKNGAGWTESDGSPFGYGGTAWGTVVDAVVKVVQGETSMEMLLDTGYTLAHNGGPIFNKGMMYNMWNQHLITVLDVQASGQVPELLLDPTNYNLTKPGDLYSLVHALSVKKPHEFKGYVDWFKVSHKGDVDPYASYKLLQPNQPKTVPVAPKVVSIKGTKTKVVGTYTYYPGQAVNLLERISA